MADTEAARTQPYKLRGGGDEPMNPFTKYGKSLLGSVYFFVILCIVLFMTILELAIGSSFSNQCPLNSNIPEFLIAKGACGMVVAVLSLIIVS